MANVKNRINIQWLERALVIGILDVIFIAASFFFGLWMRYEFQYSAIPKIYIIYYIRTMIPWIIISIFVFSRFRLYNSIWVFVGFDELFRVVLSYGILLVIEVVAVFLLPFKMPIAYYVIGIILSFMCTVGIRFSYRILRRFLNDVSFDGKDDTRERIMIIGAGEAGRILINEYARSSYVRGNVVCIIDDNPSKRNRILEGIPIVGASDEIPEMVKTYRVDKIVFAIPSAETDVRRRILNICNSTGCKIQAIPGIYQLVNGEISISKLRNVDITDLLGRDQIQVNMDEIFQYIFDKVVLVTGGGGSIGSELCRQIAKSVPKRLIIFDIYENNAYDIQMELNRKYPNLNLTVLIGSVRDRGRLDAVMKEYHPEIVFHAAAHKHVPLMEDSPNESIKNNVFGTYRTALSAVEYGVKKFVLISTDKAVNPTNIMGASKRLCEMVIQMMSRKNSGTDFVAVRFGNVMGSNGSVIPLFKKQIAEGGPVTVTHPEITRFFMTIPEAVSLVLQAAYYAKGGEIFVLDMGQPVKIADMARNLIRLSGFEPDVDIRIEYTGLRPGEKLYEEVLMAEEGLRETENKLIHIGNPIEMDDEEFLRQLDRLERAYEGETDDMKSIVAEIVPTYHPAGF